MKNYIIKKATFKDEMEAENYMIDVCLENGFYRIENGEYVVYEWIIEQDTPQ